MRILVILIRKELKQIFRNKGMLPIIFAMPLIQLLILANAANYEIKNINVAILDYGKNDFIHQLSAQLDNNNYFTVKSIAYEYPSALALLDKGQVDAIIAFENDFTLNAIEDTPQIQVIINTIDGASSGIILSYLSDFMEGYLAGNNTPSPLINTQYTNKFNLKLDYKTVMVPGILVILVSVISVFLTAMNIVREKEIGTIDQLNVSPITKLQFIGGKLIPMLIIALGELMFGVIIGRLIYGIPFMGSPLTVIIFALAYLWVMLSFGLIISSRADTQQQAMLIAYVFLVIFIMFSGLFTSIESMPTWANYTSQAIPVTHFITVMRSVMLKATPLYQLGRELAILLGMGTVMFTIATIGYKKIE
ncbi:ABC transporter permease [bacterium]|nr:ABC transporter permease [bacterium]